MAKFIISEPEDVSARRHSRSVYRIDERIELVPPETQPGSSVQLRPGIRGILHISGLRLGTIRLTWQTGASMNTRHLLNAQVKA